MDFSGSIFSTISLGKLFRELVAIISLITLCFIAYRDEIDALDLANYIAIACFDVGILVLYYIFEWYHKRQGIRNNSDDETQISKELSQDCETTPDNNNELFSIKVVDSKATS
jgi:amino acid permease